MKKLCICFLTALMLCFAFAVPASAYTERKTFSQSIGYFYAEFETNYGMEYETIGEGEYGPYGDWSWETEFLLNLLSSKKKAYFYIDLPEEYSDCEKCQVRFFTNKNPDGIFYVTLEMNDGTRVNTDFKVNEYVDFPKDVKTLIFPLPYNESIGEITFAYYLDVKPSVNDIDYAKQIFTTVFSGLWGKVKSNWLASALFCIPLAFGLIMLVIKIIRSFGSVRLGGVRSSKLGGMHGNYYSTLKLGGISSPKLGNVKTYNVGSKFKNFIFNKKIRSNVSVVEIDGVKYFRNDKIKRNKKKK